MPTVRRKLITIITEAVLEPELRVALDAIGASGYTITNVRGKGSRGSRDADWATSGNIRIEVVCDRPLARTISAYMHDSYGADYAMVLYESDVRVLREEKFTWPVFGVVSACRES